MSVSISIVAQKKLTDHDRALLNAWLACVDAHIMPPQDLTDQLNKEIFGGELDPDVLPQYQPRPKDGAIEVGIGYEGDVMYGDGATFQVKDLPDGTFAIRVYAYA